MDKGLTFLLTEKKLNYTNMLEQLLTWSLIIGMFMGGLLIGEGILRLIKKYGKKF